MGKKKFFLNIFLLFFLTVYLSGVPAAVWASNIDQPTIKSSPVIRWGNTSYHDSLGARDPWAIKDNGTTYLYYDCTEDLLNPSFESNMGTNGWDTYQATITTTAAEHLFGSQSLQVTTVNQGSTGLQFGAFTGNYYYGNIHDNAHLAEPSGLEVTPNTSYIASAYVKAHVSSQVGLTVIQFTDDPGIWTNHIEPIKDTTSAWATGDWMRLIVPFTTGPSTKAITISLVTNGNVTSYWDGVQLERVSPGVTAPSDFPANIDFNKTLENTAGWRSCLATSTDGVNFTKLGPLEVTGTVETWQDNLKPGWVGADSIYFNVFPFQGKWYAYSWVAGYPVVSGNPFLVDYGSATHRFGYGDYRAFVSNGAPTRSALLVANSPLGPFQRVNNGGPMTSPNNPSACSVTNRPNNQPWGCEYLAANGVPQLINGQWVEFMDGQTWHQAGLDDWWGNWTRSNCAGDMINSGLGTASSPLGPWVPSSYSPIFAGTDLCANALVPEGPVYYYDKASNTHILFTNQLANGSITAFWTQNPLANWPVANRKVVLSAGANGQISIANGMNLPTVIDNGSTLNLYFGFREAHGNTTAQVGNYLFHDIGLATFNLPLFPAVCDPTSWGAWGSCNKNCGGGTQSRTNACGTVQTQSCNTQACITNTPIPPNTPVPIQGDLNNDNHVNIFDYNILVTNFGKTGTPGFIPSDINRDGKVDIFDYNILVGNFGR